MPRTLSLGTPSAHVDYLDFFQHDEISFLARPPGPGRSLTEADLGSEEFRIQRKPDLSGMGVDYVPVDGDASFIAAGEAVYDVKGYAPTFRLAAYHDGHLFLYEADTRARAKTGADLLDIDGRVTDIALLDPRNPRRVIGRITTPRVVQHLVRLVLAAPVELASLPRSSDVLMAFELSDGTAVVRQYSSTAGVLQRGIAVSGAFRDAVTSIGTARATPSRSP